MEPTVQNALFTGALYPYITSAYCSHCFSHWYQWKGRVFFGCFQTGQGTTELPERTNQTILLCFPYLSSSRISSLSLGSHLKDCSGQMIFFTSLFCLPSCKINIFQRRVIWVSCFADKDNLFFLTVLLTHPHWPSGNGTSIQTLTTLHAKCPCENPKTLFFVPLAWWLVLHRCMILLQTSKIQQRPCAFNYGVCVSRMSSECLSAWFADNVY